MALGGYKFKGHYVVRQEYMDDVAWARVVHKCRCATLLEASALGGKESVWEFSTYQTEAPPTIEEMEQDNCGIYEWYPGSESTEADIGGFLSFFGHKDYEKGVGYDAYYLIFTRIKSGSFLNYDEYPFGTCYKSGRVFIDKNCALFHAIGTAPFGNVVDDETGFYTSEFFRKGCLKLSNTGGIGWGMTESFRYLNSALGLSRLNFGYAIRGKDIISFYKPGNDFTAYGWRVNVSSVGGFASLSVPDDAYNVFNYSLATVSREADYYPTEMEQRDNCSDYSCKIIYNNTTLKANGNCFDGEKDYFSGMCSHLAALATYSKEASLYPYEPMSMWAYNDSYICYPDVGEGISSKGVINGELMCMNRNYISVDSNRDSMYKTFADGCLLKVWMQNGTDVSTFDTSAIKYSFYCGWDPANPDISRGDCVTEYVINS